MDGRDDEQENPIGPTKDDTGQHNFTLLPIYWLGEQSPQQYGLTLLNVVNEVKEVNSPRVHSHTAAVTLKRLPQNRHTPSPRAHIPPRGHHTGHRRTGTGIGTETSRCRTPGRGRCGRRQRHRRHRRAARRAPR